MVTLVFLGSRAGSSSSAALRFFGAGVVVCAGLGLGSFGADAVAVLLPVAPAVFAVLLFAAVLVFADAPWVVAAVDLFVLEVVAVLGGSRVAARALLLGDIWRSVDRDE